LQAFSWFALAAYIVDLIFAIIAFLKARAHRSETAVHQETTTTATTETARY